MLPIKGITISSLLLSLLLPYHYHSFYVQTVDVSNLTETQVHSTKVVIDNTPPLIQLHDTNVLVRNHWTPSNLIKSVFDESDFMITHTITELEDEKQAICIIASDQFQNTSQQCRDYSMIEISDPLIAKYYASSLEMTLLNYLDFNQIELEKIGLSYYNLTTNERITINSNNSFKAASSIKFPLGVIIYDYLRQKKILKNETIKYQKKHNVGGTTLIPKYFRYGDAVSMQTLLKFMLIYSDNNATQMLFDRLSPFGKWQNIMTDFYHVPNDSIQVIGNVVTADYMMTAIEYVLNHQDQYEEFINYLTIAYPKRYLKKYLEDIPIMHKCGFYAGNINDMGVVYGENPYAIVILTRQIPEAEHHIGTINAIIYAYLSFQNLLTQANESSDSVTQSVSASIMIDLITSQTIIKRAYYILDSEW